MSRAHPSGPAIQTVLRWVAQTIATTTDRTLCGVLLLDELDRQARGEGACLTRSWQLRLRSSRHLRSSTC